MANSWYCIETKPKGERLARDEIAGLGLDAYLPEYEIERFNRRKRVKIITRLCHFPRYLFAEIEPRHFSAVLACRGVSDILPGFPRSPIAVRGADVLKLRAAQEAKLFDDTDEARRLRGETVKHTLAATRKRLAGSSRVRIKAGPFMGHHGDVEAVHSLERLTVLISLFGRPTEVHLGMEQIEELAA